MKFNRKPVYIRMRFDSCLDSWPSRRRGPRHRRSSWCSRSSVDFLPRRMTSENKESLHSLNLDNWHIIRKWVRILHFYSSVREQHFAQNVEILDAIATKKNILQYYDARKKKRKLYETWNIMKLCFLSQCNY